MEEVNDETPLIEGNGVRKVRIFLLLLAVFLFPLAASQVVVYDLLYKVVCTEYGILPDQCLNDPLATKFVADLLSAVSLVNGIVATLMMAIMASLSDRMGRKVGLVWNLSLSTVGVALFALYASGAFQGLTPWRLLAPYFATALSGSASLTLNLSVLYISDCLFDSVSRTHYLSVMLGVFMLIQAAAPGLGSVWLKSGVGIASYLSACAVMMTIGTTLVVWHLASKRNTESFSLVSHFKDSLNEAIGIVSFRDCQPRVQRRNAWIILINFFFSNEFAVGFLDLLIVYAKHTYGWEFAQVGQIMFYLFSVRCLWALLGFPFTYSQLSKKWPPNSQQVDWLDIVHMVVSAVLTVAGYIAIAFAKTSTQYKTGIIVLANDGISGPIWVNALLKHVAENKRGAFLASLGLFMKPLGAILPACLMKIYQATIDTNAVFLVVATMSIAAALSLAFLRVREVE